MMNFVNIHVLSTHPFSNMNRDDAGSPKTVTFGGSTRVRLSSQALKRAARLHLETQSTGERSFRSHYLPQEVTERVVELLASSGRSLSDEERADVLAAARTSVRSLTHKKPGSDDKKANAAKKTGPGTDDAEAVPAGKGSDKKETLVWIAEQEVARLVVTIAGKVGGQTWETEISEALGQRTDSLAIAAFGRMFAARPELQTEAAVQVAHAFTTHEAAMEVDYFTTVDDLSRLYAPDRGAGAGYLDLAEYASGTFYRYFNIDRRQLRANWAGFDGTNATERLGDLVQALVLSLPSGKANTTAPQTLPLLVVIEEAAMPASFADAFEKPVVSRAGYGQSSVEALLDHRDKCHHLAPAMFGRAVVVNREDRTGSLEEALRSVGAWLAVDDDVQEVAAQ